MQNMELQNLDIKTVRPAALPTPLRFAGNDDHTRIRYREDTNRVMLRAAFDMGEDQSGLSFERAGPRSHIAYDPKRMTAAIVTCGGLCPGLNDVIRAMVMCLWHRYGVRNILGIRYGFHGLSDPEIRPMELTPNVVQDIHKDGGTMLGASRGYESEEMVVNGLVRYGIDLLFVIGGDGSQRGAHDTWTEIERRGLQIGVVGIPKTVDNDIAWVDQSFGFDTAVTVATAVVEAAHVEARSAHNGVGLVKLMGRDAGWLAAYASLASMDADVVLIPEVPFDLDGDHGLIPYVRHLLAKKGHACLVVSEGAGQHLFDDERTDTDASGNVRHHDIGTFLRERLSVALPEASLKYFDPSYVVRSAPANANDSVFCARLAHNAVHAGMAGKTDMMLGRWYAKFTHIPLNLVASGTKHLNPRSAIWRTVLEATGQPAMAR
ncbi:MAG: ATP-dependent 6-phosphofructokinase [Planctomycetota bacterium]